MAKYECRKCGPGTVWAGSCQSCDAEGMPLVVARWGHEWAAVGFMANAINDVAFYATSYGANPRGVVTEDEARRWCLT